MPLLVNFPLKVVDRPNESGRIYPRQLAERLVQAHDTAHMLVYAHVLPHPALDSVVGQVSRLQLSEDGQLNGSALLLDTPQGLDLQQLYLNGCNLKFDMIGSGTVRNGVVQNDYRLEGLSVRVDLSTCGPDKDAKLRKVLRAKQRKRGLHSAGPA